MLCNKVKIITKWEKEIINKSSWFAGCLPPLHDRCLDSRDASTQIGENSPQKTKESNIMSRAIGFANGSIAGGRVAGQDGRPAMTYIPAHIDASGKTLNQRCTIPIYVNKKNRRDGGPGKSDQFMLVAWGPLADACARSLSNGQAIDCAYVPESYTGRSYDSEGNPRLEANGTPVNEKKIVFKITTIIFGEESGKVVEQEIATGRRPVNWSNKSHPDAQLWITMLTAKQATQYVPGSATFGNARVITPPGQLVTQVPTGPGPAAQAARTANAGQRIATPATIVPQATAQATAQADLLAAAVAKVLAGQAAAIPVPPVASPAPAGVDPATGFPTTVPATEVGVNRTF